MSRSRRAIVVSLAMGCGLMLALTGCESLQRKLTRKPKHPAAAPGPIINFQDYSRAMTPLDRYRKHYLIFDYWNGELLAGLLASPLNPKRYKRASSESLAELETMQGLLSDEMAMRLAPLVEQRTKLNQQLQSPAFSAAQSPIVSRTVEQQSREIHRDFFWRDVEDRLKPQPASPEPNARSD